jgi:DNA-binding LytR/AlgR family response regulator
MAEVISMDIPVVNVATGKAGVIDSAKVLFVQADGSTTIHTASETYKPAYSLKDFAEILLPEGFEYLDKSNLANINRVKSFDEIKNRAYFDKLRKGKSIKVSRRNIEKMEDVDR